MSTLDQIYDDTTLKDRRLYPVAEAAHALRVSTSTLRW